MKKHNFWKAMFLVVIMFFHSFVLIPKASAVSMGTVIDIAAARQVLRSVAPSVINATPAGRGYAIAYFGIAAVGYLIVKSGAITAIKNWFSSNALFPAPNGASSGTQYFTLTDGWTGSCNATASFNGSKWCGWLSNSWGSGGSGNTFGDLNTGYNYDSEYDAKTAAYQKLLWAGDTYGWNGHAWDHWGTGTGSYPTVPGDYGDLLQASQPEWPADSVFFSPGGSEILNGLNPVGTITEMSDAELDNLISTLGATAVDSDGIQPRPNTNDNTLSNDANATIPYLQQIMNYVSNLLGIKSNSDRMVDSLDNIVGALANPVENPVNMDNVVNAINAQSEIDNAISLKMDNVIQSVQGMQSTESTESSIRTRIDSLKIAASSKFPFSIAGSLSVSAVTGASTYEFAPLPLTPTISIPINPMAGPLAATFTWFRQMIVWFFWLGTLFAILKKGMEM